MAAPKDIPVIIETPKGSAEKYNYDAALKCFKLKKILPTGMVFPYDFGFIPGTLGGDGDPLDVIVISEFKSFPGCMMDVRIIGAVLAEQTSKEDGKVRNDRFLAVSSLSTIFSDIHKADDLPAGKLDELQQFFINYNAIEGKKFKPVKVISPAEAVKLINKQKNG